MTESEHCELVLNAVFYWEPVVCFQKRCDTISLRFFQDEPCGVVLDLLYARDLFIGYTCESSIALGKNDTRLYFVLLEVCIAGKFVLTVIWRRA